MAPVAHQVIIGWWLPADLLPIQALPRLPLLEVRNLRKVQQVGSKLLAQVKLQVTVWLHRIRLRHVLEGPHWLPQLQKGLPVEAPAMYRRRIVRLLAIAFPPRLVEAGLQFNVHGLTDKYTSECDIYMAMRKEVTAITAHQRALRWFLE